MRLNTNRLALCKKSYPIIFTRVLDQSTAAFHHTAGSSGRVSLGAKSRVIRCSSVILTIAKSIRCENPLLRSLEY